MTEVLCISAGAVARLYHAQAAGWFCSTKGELDEFQRLVTARSLFVDRARAESDPSFVQIIPSCVIASGSRILCLERSADSSRAELKSKWTSLFGGHVDRDDQHGSPWNTIITGVKREIREELGIHINGHTPEFAGLAIDPTNATGRLHLGLVFCYFIKGDGVRLTQEQDLSEFKVAKMGVVHLFSRKELFHVQDRFDPWSTLFLRSDFAREKFREDVTVDDDLPLLRRAN